MVADDNLARIDTAIMRQAMVNSQLRVSGVDDEAVIRAMTALPRELFVPAAWTSLCYMDRAIPLANGRVLNPALAAGLMLIRAGNLSGKRVLVLASGSGYLAVLAAMLGADVSAVEDDAALSALAPTELYAKHAIATQASGRYDIIFIDGAVEMLPEGLAAQLADKGQVITGLAQGAVTRLAHGAVSGDQIVLTSFVDTDIAPLAAYGRPQAYRF